MSTAHSSFDAAIVDLDGTLVDTLPDFDVALNAMMRELHLPAVDVRTIESMIGRGSEYLIRALLEHVGAPAARFDEAWDSYWKNYLAINGDHSRVYPGAREGLAALREAGLKLACLTNKPTAFAQPLLDRMQIAPFFDIVFGGDAFERKKPDPLPTIRACEALGTSASRALVIGDSSNDARAARAAGCPVVLVTYGYNHGEPVQRIDADGYVDSIAEVPDWIRRRACPEVRP
ncbi:MAG TPA: phosphoglycolate phosphatase [Ramlibacter sp.]|nr:phosphoglycolate phosphatase [Ramlibacter sp.]